MKRSFKHYLKRIKEDGLFARFWVSNILLRLGVSAPFSVSFDKETNTKIKLSPTSVAHEVFRGNLNPVLNKEVFKKFVSKGDVVFDVGANIGIYTLFAARLIGKEGSVYAFEPTRSTFCHLLDNISLIDDLGSATPVYSAVSENDGLAELYDYKYSKEQNYLNTSSDAQQNAVSVPTTRLDTFMENKNVSKIDFLKIDVEGAEFSVLKSLGDKLPSVSVIFFESSPRMYNRYGYKVEDVVSFLKQAGFKIFQPSLIDGSLKLSIFTSDHVNSAPDLVAVNNNVDKNIYLG